MKRYKKYKELKELADKYGFYIYEIRKVGKLYKLKMSAECEGVYPRTFFIETENFNKLRYKVLESILFFSNVGITRTLDYENPIFFGEIALTNMFWRKVNKIKKIKNYIKKLGKKYEK